MLKVIKTNYDGYIVTKNEKGKICAYEGYDLCPIKVQKILDKGEYGTIDSFAREAIEYGYV